MIDEIMSGLSCISPCIAGVPPSGIHDTGPGGAWRGADGSSTAFASMSGTMKRLLFALTLLATAAFAAEPHPGYGVVKVIDRIPAQESASAGASKASSQRYLVKVQLDDGSLQVRSVKGPHKLKAGDRVLVTNAGDVVRDYGYAQSGVERGAAAPGTAPDGARPQDGAIQGGSILPGEKSGVPNETPGKAVERCEELQGRLREQCLLKEEQDRSSVGGTRQPPVAAPPPNAPPPQNPR
jgi:hypothetical protein